MDFYILRRTAALTSVGLESLDQLRAPDASSFDWSLVDQGCFPEVSEGDTPEPCDQWIFAFTFDDDGEHFIIVPEGVTILLP